MERANRLDCRTKGWVSKNIFDLHHIIFSLKDSKLEGAMLIEIIDFWGSIYLVDRSSSLGKFLYFLNFVCSILKDFAKFITVSSPYMYRCRPQAPGSSIFQFLLPGSPVESARHFSPVQTSFLTSSFAFYSIIFTPFASSLLSSTFSLLPYFLLVCAFVYFLSFYVRSDWRNPKCNPNADLSNDWPLDSYQVHTCTGAWEGLPLFLMVAGTLEDSYITTCRSKQWFCLYP